LRRWIFVAVAVVLGWVAVFVWVRTSHEGLRHPDGNLKRSVSIPSKKIEPSSEPSKEKVEGSSDRIERLPEPHKGSSPFGIAFLIPEGSAGQGESVPIELAIRSHPSDWPEEAYGEMEWQFLLRLPVGVKLESPDWAVHPIPKEEENDPTGPWFLFERTLPTHIERGSLPEALVRQTLMLKVVEPGTNWIVSIRARLVKDKQAWQTFGIIFATLDETGRATFHEMPRSYPTHHTPDR